jgi:hypothetical protein
VLGSLSIAYPEPTRSGAIGTQVLLIGTTGDVAEATRQVRQWYAGSLCVRSVPHSRAQMLAARTVIEAALTDPAQQERYGLLGGVGESVVGGDPRTSMMVLVYDERAQPCARRPALTWSTSSPSCTSSTEPPARIPPAGRTKVARRPNRATQPSAGQRG